MRALLVTVLILLLSAATGCASSEEQERDERIKAAQEDARSALEEHRDEAAEREDEAAADRQVEAVRADYELCRAQTDGMMRALDVIEARTADYVDFEDHNELVDDLNHEYATLNRSISGECVDVAVKLEDARNSYVRAHNAWIDCLNTAYCDPNDSAEGDRIDTAWAKASSLHQEALETLERMRP